MTAAMFSGVVSSRLLALHAELWDSDAWSAKSLLETTPENIAAVIEELEF